MTRTTSRYKLLFAQTSSWVVVACLTTLAGAAQDPIPVSECGTLVKSPGQYQVTGNLLDCPEHGIVVAADDVYLDVNSKLITGDDSSAFPGGVGIRIQNANHVLVNGRLGSVTGFSTGVEVKGSVDVVVGNLTGDGGLFVVGNAEGMAVRNSYSTTLSLNNIGSSEGFNVVVDKSIDTVLDRLNVGGNAPRGGGIRIGSGSANTLVFQNVIGPGFTGVGIEIEKSSETRVEGSFIFASTEAGLRMKKSPGTLIGGLAAEQGNAFGLTPGGFLFPNLCDLDIIAGPEPILQNNFPGDTAPPLTVCP